MVTGSPCLGSWVSYGLGSANENLPTFVVLVAKPTNTEQIQATKDPVHIRDFYATVWNLLGFDRERFTHRYLGLDQLLTGVEKANVVKELIL